MSEIDHVAQSTSGSLISIVGIAGSGKTTLARTLAPILGANLALEEPQMRPFQARAKRDAGLFLYCNQLDFFLARAAQEMAARSRPGMTLSDGGLDLDYWLFTQQFAQTGALSCEDAQACTQLYQRLRQALPVADRLIYLKTPLGIAKERLLQRGRKLELTQIDELAEQIQRVENWLSTQTTKVLVVDGAQSIAQISTQLQQEIAPIK